MIAILKDGDRANGCSRTSWTTSFSISIAEAAFAHARLQNHKPAGRLALDLGSA